MGDKMGRIKLGGYFSGETSKPLQVMFTAGFSGNGMGETLTLECQEGYRVSVPYRPLERLAGEALAAYSRDKSPVELSLELKGYDGNRRSGQTVAYVRVSDGFAMLTLEFMNMGQMSAPFAPIQKLAKTQRGRFA